MPFSFWNNYSSAIINSLNRKIEIQKKVVKKDIFSGLFPFVEKAGIFYSMYGKNGFNEYQILVEDKHASFAQARDESAMFSNRVSKRVNNTN